MAVQKPIPITAQGLVRLRAELDDLLTNKRPAAAALIQQTLEESAGTQTDGEYEEAKNEQAFMEGRIRKLEEILANAQVIDETEAHNPDSVHLGATVTVTVGRKRQRFTIVGMAEVDPSHGFVSDESPVGRALLGRSLGETVDVEAPSGTIKMKIKAIE
ncbi:MAG: transcription elongation factor GreA [Chloroflexi bacterium]|nr:MAG: transcription elongation factor GreA [Chloroflexota bacterium]